MPDLNDLDIRIETAREIKKLRCSASPMPGLSLLALETLAAADEVRHVIVNAIEMTRDRITEPHQLVPFNNTLVRIHEKFGENKDTSGFKVVGKRRRERAYAY